MKFNSVIAGIASICLIGGAVPVMGMALPDAAITAFAEEDYTEGTYGYLTYAKYTDHVEITDCNTSSAKAVIPAEIEGLPVTSIGYNAFYACTSLTSITLPDSVTSIGFQSFCSCLSLTSITIPNSVTSIGDSAFFGCKNLTSITIPDGVTSIGHSVFVACKNLTSITIPDGVTSIGYSAFSGCNSLASITIPESVTSIGKRAFESTKWLEKERAIDPLVIVNNILIDGTTCNGDIIIPDGVTSICGLAFSKCYDLTSVIIPDSVINIGYGAFENCKSLTSITIPESVTSIEDIAFYVCKSLTSITILNPDCEIFDSKSTIDNTGTLSFTGTIYGYDDSTAQDYAEKYGYTFVSLGEAPITTLYGDANDNGDVEVADAVFILQGLADPSNEEFKRSEQGEINADCHNTGNGVDSEDALAILKFKAMIIDELPYQG